MRLWSAKRSFALAPPEARAPQPSAWTGARYDSARARAAGRGHVESWFLKANDPRSRRALWLRWTLWAGDRAPDRALAEAWAVAFDGAAGHVATKTTVPFERASFGRRGLDVTVDGCRLAWGGASGRVESGGRSVAYDVRIEPLGPEMLLLPARWMYASAVPFQKVVSPLPDVRVHGTATVQGETWVLDGWPGMVGHNWGYAHSEYAWGHCNAWDGEDDDVVLEGFTLRPGTGRVGSLSAAWSRLGGLVLPSLTALSLRQGGQEYRLNGFASLARNVGSMTPRRWSFRALGSRVEVAGEMWADTEDFVGLFYAQPDGRECYCLNSKLARAEVTISVSGRPPRTLRSERASLELATADPHHGVRMYV